jgi:hypothetical protein
LVTAEIRDCAETLSGIEAQLAGIDTHLSILRRGDAVAGSLHYTILRSSGQGPTRLPATLATAVLPGDLIEVEVVNSRISELD